MIGLLDIVRQDSALGRLQQALRGGRMPHAYMFTGPAGVGRRTTAEAFAALLLCDQPISRANNGGLTGLDDEFSLSLACGQCDSCRMMTAGTHPDFHLIYKELARYHDDAGIRSRVMQDLGIAVIRSFLIGPAGRSASHGRGKVFVVLESELMSIPAQNALLKTLEEPPAGVTIILICRRAEQMLPTTRSRCSIVRFGPLPRDFVATSLVETGISAGEADFWAAFTGGSIGRASALAAEGMYEIKQDVIERFGSLSPAGDAELADYLAGVTDKLARAAVSAVRKAQGAELSKALASRRVAGTILQLIASAFRDALKLATGAELPLINADQPGPIEVIAERFDPNRLAEIIEAIGRCEWMLWRNVNLRLVWDNVVITCSSAVPLRV